MIKIKKIFGIVFSAFLFVSLMANSPIQLLFAAAPTVIIGASASSITKTIAVANINITDDGNKALTNVGIEYGLTTSYGSTVNREPYSYFNEPPAFFTSDQGSGDGELNSPEGIALDSIGNIYVADTFNSRVQKFNSSGVYQSQFGTAGSGDGQFNSPSGIALDSIGNIYVVDTNNHRVQKFNSSGVYQSQFGTSGGGNGQLASPTGIMIDSSNNIFVIDNGNSRVQKFNSSGVYQSQFGTSGTGNGEFSFSNKSELDIDSLGNIYVVDKGNDRVQKFNSSGVYQSQFGTTGTGNGEFSTPSALVVDEDDYVYVLDAIGGRIQKFDSSGNFISTNANTSNIGSTSTYGVAINSDKELFIVNRDDNYLVKIVQDVITVNLTGLTCGTTYHYRAFATNADGTSYSSDDTFTTLSCEPPILETKEVTSITKTSATIHGLQTSDGAFTPSVRGFEYGTTPAYGSSVNVSPSSIMDSTQLSLNTSDSSINQDSSGNMYIAYSGENSIQIFDSGFNLLFGFGWGVETGASQFETCTSSCLAGISGTGNGQFNSPQSVAVDSSTGNIFVSDSGNNRIQIFNLSGVYQSQFGSLGSGDGQFITPNGIQIVSLSGVSYVFVADTENNRIQKFTTSGTFVGKVGTGTQFSSPSSLAVSNAGGLYVADTGNNRIQYIDPVTLSAGAVTFILPSGQASISSPRGVAFDSSDNMYISDTGNNYIDFAVKEGVSNYRIISFYTNVPTPYDHLKEIFVANSGWGVNAGTIYFSDGHNNVIRSLNTPFMSTELSSLSCGTTYYYRPFATNSDGTGYGTEGTFTTSSCGGSTGSGGGGGNPPVPGCTDSLAENYNSFADVDNGTCTYEADIWGCVNPFATNYNILATQSDGSCVFDDVIPGPNDVFGCKDLTALNYNPAVTQDDGSCTYPTVLPDPNDIFGCIDSTALNYNSSATKNDGSCEYAPGEDPKDNDPGLGGGTDLPGGTSKKIIPRAFEYVIRIFDKVPTPWLKTLAEIALAVSIPLRIWNLIPAILGFRRKRRPWGTVYDSVTKQPLDPVYVTLKNLFGKDISTLITDLDGRYGFLTEKGDYTLSANKADYVFPSQKMAGQTKDELYDNLYFGETLNVKEDGEIINKNIPMDATKFNWNEFEKTKNKKLMKFFSNTELALAKFATVLFIAGFTSSVILTFLEPRLWNYIILGLYLLLLSLPLFGLKAKKPGFIFDKETGFPMSFGIVKVFSAMLQKEIAHAVVGKTGKYFILVPKGKYYIKLQKKTGENDYQDVYTSDSFNVRSGYINKVIKI